MTHAICRILYMLNAELMYCGRASPIEICTKKNCQRQGKPNITNVQYRIVLKRKTIPFTIALRNTKVTISLSFLLPGLCANERYSNWIDYSTLDLPFLTAVSPKIFTQIQFHLHNVTATKNEKREIVRFIVEVKQRIQAIQIHNKN